MKFYKKAILPLGFKANGLACGIKKSGKLDLALFYSQSPARASCKFTTNKIQAAPLKVNKKHLRINREYRAIIANSGNANCFTGDLGILDAQETVRALAEFMHINKTSVLAASTGIIGRRLTVYKIKNAIPNLVKGLSKNGIDKAKKAIMTTDKFAKEITVKFNLGGKTVTVCGVAKGAGMIAPDMATMLAFIFTDAQITQDALDKALTSAVEGSFNCITVDGCMSTNDSVIVLANGASKNTLIAQKSRHFPLFSQALNTACLELAKLIVTDAEGATKFIRIKVSGARNFSEAKKAALAIANSNLFKTAVYGQNPNFGRIVSSIGASGIEVKEEDLKIRVSSLKRKSIDVDVDIKRGFSCAVVYTSDLTPEYVRINAEYN